MKLVLIIPPIRIVLIYLQNFLMKQNDLNQQQMLQELEHGNNKNQHLVLLNTLKQIHLMKRIHQSVLWVHHRIPLTQEMILRKRYRLVNELKVK
jgi:hypothetical protein